MMKGVPQRLLLLFLVFLIFALLGYKQNSSHFHSFITAVSDLSSSDSFALAGGQQQQQQQQQDQDEGDDGLLTLFKLRESEYHEDLIPHHPNRTHTRLPSQCRVNRTDVIQNNNASMDGFLNHSHALEVAEDVIFGRWQSGGGGRHMIKILRALYRAGMIHNRFVMTLQIGGMDGVQGDPMFKATKPPRSLPVWMPIVVEPSPINFDQLVMTYDKLQTTAQITCPLLLRQAVAYDDDDDDDDDDDAHDDDDDHHDDKKRETTSRTMASTNERRKGNTNTRTFCYINTTMELCTTMPPWVQYQISSLDCDKVRDIVRYHLRDQTHAAADSCVVENNVACRGVLETMQMWNLNLAHVSFLQIDIEGYEANVLTHMMQEIMEQYEEPHLYRPPILHFESKILDQLKQLEPLLDLLKRLGYHFIQVGHVDALAIRFPEEVLQKYQTRSE